MARRTERVTPGKTVTRETRMSSRKVEVTDEAGAVVKPGLGLPEAIAIVTTILLLAAILTTDYWMGTSMGEGMFFKP
jgi:hypothetical protein